MKTRKVKLLELYKKDHRFILIVFYTKIYIHHNFRLKIMISFKILPFFKTKIISALYSYSLEQSLK